MMHFTMRQDGEMHATIKIAHHPGRTELINAVILDYIRGGGRQLYADDYLLPTSRAKVEDLVRSAYADQGESFWTATDSLVDFVDDRDGTIEEEIAERIDQLFPELVARMKVDA